MHLARLTPHWQAIVPSPIALIHTRIAAALVSLLAGVLLSGAAHAGAWLQQEGHGLAIAQLAGSVSDEVYDTNGKKAPQEAYKQRLLSLYGEYGVNDWLTLGASANAIYSEQFSAAMGDDANATALTEPSLFARYGIVRDGNHRLSLQGTLQLPRYRVHEDGLTLGNPNSEYELALQYGYSFSVASLPTFIDAHLGYRYRADQPGDQIRTTLTGGIRPLDQWMLLLQAFGTWRTDRGNSGGAATGFTQSNADDYDQLRLQASAVYALNQDWSVQAGYFQDVYGRNFGIARGALIGVWRQF